MHPDTRGGREEQAVDAGTMGARSMAATILVV